MFFSLVCHPELIWKEGKDIHVINETYYEAQAAYRIQTMVHCITLTARDLFIYCSHILPSCSRRHTWTLPHLITTKTLWSRLDWDAVIGPWLTSGLHGWGGIRTLASQILVQHTNHYTTQALKKEEPADPILSHASTSKLHARVEGLITTTQGLCFTRNGFCMAGVSYKWGLQCEQTLFHGMCLYQHCNFLGPILLAWSYPTTLTNLCCHHLTHVIAALWWANNTSQ